MVAGHATTIEAHIQLESWQRNIGTLRLRLRGPSGAMLVCEDIERLELGHYRATPVLPESGLWEYQFETEDAEGNARVLEYGTVRVRGTGFF